MTPRVIVIIAAFNEEENIRRVVHEVTSCAPACDYIVIDDGSTDATGRICDKEGFHVIHLPSNLGIGGAVQTGYRYALKNGYDIAVQLDADGQHNAADIGALIEPIVKDEADYCVGSRFIAQHGAQKDGEQKGFLTTPARRAGIVFLSGLIRLLCGEKIYDVTSGFRAVNRWFIENFARNYPADYPEPEAIMDAAMNRARILEVPVTMRRREKGVSSINARRSVYYMIKVTLDIIICRISYGVRRGYPLLEAKQKEAFREEKA